MVESRQNRTSTDSPPLKVWLVVAGITLLLGLYSYPYYQTWAKIDPSFVKENSKRIEAFSRHPADGGVKVVALGNSALYRCTFYDETMEELSLLSGIKNFHFLRIARQGGILSHFLPLRDALFEASPDAIIFQSDLLLFYGQKKTKPYGRFVREVVAMNVNLARMKRSRSRNRLQDEMIAPQMRKGSKLLNKRIAQWQKKAKGAPMSQVLLREIVNEARQKGIQIIVLDAPRYDRHDEIISNTVNPEREELINVIRNEFHLPWLRYPEQMGSEYFYDFAHTNEKGREEFSKWLVSALDELFEQGGRQ